jgi:hypothetical protein
VEGQLHHEKQEAIDMEVRAAVLNDCEVISANMRESDKVELRAATGESPRAALINSYENTAYPYTIVHEGEPVAMFGVGESPLYDAGIIWLLATDELEKHPITFAKHSEEWIEKISAPYKVVTNMVYAKNTTTLRWLEWCGFTLLAPKPFGKSKELFIQIVRY